MKEIRIAVIADKRGFSDFTNQFDNFLEIEMPYTLKFILIDDEIKTKGAHFNSYISHFSGVRLDSYSQILKRVKSRIMAIQ